MLFSTSCSGEAKRRSTTLCRVFWCWKWGSFWGSHLRRVQGKDICQLLLINFCRPPSDAAVIPWSSAIRTYVCCIGHILKCSILFRTETTFDKSAYYVQFVLIVWNLSVRSLQFLVFVWWCNESELTWLQSVSKLKSELHHVIITFDGWLKTQLNEFLLFMCSLGMTHCLFVPCAGPLSVPGNQPFICKSSWLADC